MPFNVLQNSLWVFLKENLVLPYFADIIQCDLLSWHVPLVSRSWRDSTHLTHHMKGMFTIQSFCIVVNIVSD